MRFNRVPAHHLDKPQLGQESAAQVWLPSAFPKIKSGAPSYEGIEADLLGETRILGIDVVRMAMAFDADQRRRSQLGHDAVVFALACESGNDQADQPFNRAGGKVVRVGSVTYQDADRALQEPDMMVGGVIFTADDPSADKPLRDARPHFMVRATRDKRGPNLYFSKLGREGPVVLSSVEDLMPFYDIKTIGVASHFYTAPFENRAIGQ